MLAPALGPVLNRAAIDTKEDHVISPDEMSAWMAAYRTLQAKRWAAWCIVAMR